MSATPASVNGTANGVTANAAATVVSAAAATTVSATTVTQAAASTTVTQTAAATTASTAASTTSTAASTAAAPAKKTWSQSLAVTQPARLPVSAQTVSAAQKTQWADIPDDEEVANKSDGESSEKSQNGDDEDDDSDPDAPKYDLYFLRSRDGAKVHTVSEIQRQLSGLSVSDDAHEDILFVRNIQSTTATKQKYLTSNYLALLSKKFGKQLSKKKDEWTFVNDQHVEELSVLTRCTRFEVGDKHYPKERIPLKPEWNPYVLYLSTYPNVGVKPKHVENILKQRMVKFENSFRVKTDLVSQDGTPYEDDSDGCQTYIFRILTKAGQTTALVDFNPYKIVDPEETVVKIRQLLFDSSWEDKKDEEKCTRMTCNFGKMSDVNNTRFKIPKGAAPLLGSGVVPNVGISAVKSAPVKPQYSHTVKAPFVPTAASGGFRPRGIGAFGTVATVGTGGTATVASSAASFKPPAGVLVPHAHTQKKDDTKITGNGTVSAPSNGNKPLQSLPYNAPQSGFQPQQPQSQQLPAFPVQPIQPNQSLSQPLQNFHSEPQQQLDDPNNYYNIAPDLSQMSMICIFGGKTYTMTFTPMAPQTQQPVMQQYTQQQPYMQIVHQQQPQQQAYAQDYSGYMHASYGAAAVGNAGNTSGIAGVAGNNQQSQPTQQQIAYNQMFGGGGAAK